jgi:hypothetical protein
MCRWCAQSFTPVRPRQATCDRVCARALRVEQALGLVVQGCMCAWCGLYRAFVVGGARRRR